MKKLGELLIEQGKLSESDVERARLAKSKLGHLLGQVLVKMGLISYQDVAASQSQQLDIPLLRGIDVPRESIYLANVIDHK